MADPQQEFVHPVIEAMLGAYDRIQQAKKEQFNQQLDTREADLRQQQFQELQNEHKLAEKHANEQHDINLGLLDIQRRQHSLDLTKQINDFIASGGKGIPDMIPGVMSSINGEPTGVMTPDQPSGRLRVPNSDVTYDPNGFSSPQENQQRVVDFQTQLEGAKTTAQSQAEEPFKVAASQRDQANRLKEIALQGTNAAEVARINHANQLDLEKLRGHFQLAAAQIAHQHGIEDQAPLINNALDGILNGQTQYSALPKDIKESVSQLAGTKGWQLPTNQVTYQKNLNAISSVQELINQARDLAVNYSRDSGGQSGLAQTYSNLTGKPAPFTDLKAKLDTFKANGGTLASFYDQQNRKSDQEIIRQALGMFDPQATMKQNLDKIAAQKGPLNNLVKSTFAGMKPDQINYILQNRGVSDLGLSDNQKETPDWLKIAPKTNTNGATLDEDKSLEVGHPVYKRSQ